MWAIYLPLVLTVVGLAVGVGASLAWNTDQRGDHDA